MNANTTLTPLIKSLMADPHAAHRGSKPSYGPADGSYASMKWPAIPSYSSAQSTPPSSPPMNVFSEFGTDSSSDTEATAKLGQKHIHPKKYVCNQSGCSKTFTTSGHLARHRRIHSGDRQFMCPWHGCGKRFSRQDNMRQHLKTHSRDRNGAAKRMRTTNISAAAMAAALGGSPGLPFMSTLSAPSTPMYGHLGTAIGRSALAHSVAQIYMPSAMSSQFGMGPARHDMALGMETGPASNNSMLAAMYATGNPHPKGSLGSSGVHISTPLISSAHSTPLINTFNPYHSHVQSQLYHSANTAHTEQQSKDRDMILQQLRSLNTGVTPCLYPMSGSATLETANPASFLQTTEAPEARSAAAGSESCSEHAQSPGQKSDVASSAASRVGSASATPQSVASVTPSMLGASADSAAPTSPWRSLLFEGTTPTSAIDLASPGGILLPGATAANDTLMPSFSGTGSSAATSKSDAAPSEGNSNHFMSLFSPSVISGNTASQTFMWQ